MKRLIALGSRGPCHGGARRSRDAAAANDRARAAGQGTDEAGQGLEARERADRGEIQANYTGDACTAATMGDLFQSTWATIDQGAAAPKFAGEPQAADKDSCKSMGVTRLGLKSARAAVALRDHVADRLARR